VTARIRHDPPATRPVVVAGLAAGLAVREVAEALGASPRTVERMLAGDPTIRREADELRRGQIAAVAGALRAAAPTAIATLVEVMGDESQPGQSRLAAARAVLSEARTWTDASDLQARVADWNTYSMPGTRPPTIDAYHGKRAPDRGEALLRRWPGSRSLDAAPVGKRA